MAVCLSSGHWKWCCAPMKTNGMTKRRQFFDSIRWATRCWSASLSPLGRFTLRIAIRQNKPKQFIENSIRFCKRISFISDFQPNSDCLILDHVRIDRNCQIELKRKNKTWVFLIQAKLLITANREKWQELFGCYCHHCHHNHHHDWQCRPRLGPHRRHHRNKMKTFFAILLFPHSNCGCVSADHSTGGWGVGLLRFSLVAQKDEKWKLFDDGAIRTSRKCHL